MNYKLNKDYLIEINKLMLGLAERGISFTFTQIYDGSKVDVPSQNWDAVFHMGSYGHELGFLEVMGEAVNRNPDDTVEGWLTADVILKRIDKNKGV